jgi:hypothetical protein
MQTAQEVYCRQIQILPPSEQLRLATIILQGLTAAEARSVDFYSDDWSDEDLTDAAIFSARHAAESLGEE